MAKTTAEILSETIYVDSIEQLSTLGGPGTGPQGAATKTKKPINGQRVVIREWAGAGNGGAEISTKYDAGSSAAVDFGFVFDGINGDNRISTALANISTAGVGTGRFIKEDRSHATAGGFGATAPGGVDVYRRLQAMLNASRTCTIDPGLTYYISTELSATRDFSDVSGYGATLKPLNELNAALFVSPLNKATIRGLTVDNDGGNIVLTTKSGAGIWGTGGKKVTLKDCFVKDCSPGGTANAFAASAPLGEINYEGCYSLNSGYGGFWANCRVQRCVDCTVEYDTIRSGYQYRWGDFDGNPSDGVNYIKISGMLCKSSLAVDTIMNFDHSTDAGGRTFVDINGITVDHPNYVPGAPNETFKFTSTRRVNIKNVITNTTGIGFFCRFTAGVNIVEGCDFYGSIACAGRVIVKDSDQKEGQLNNYFASAAHLADEIHYERVKVKGFRSISDPSSAGSAPANQKIKLIDFDWEINAGVPVFMFSYITKPQQLELKNFQVTETGAGTVAYMSNSIGARLIATGRAGIDSTLYYDQPFRNCYTGRTGAVGTTLTNVTSGHTVQESLPGDNAFPSLTGDYIGQKIINGNPANEEGPGWQWGGATWRPMIPIHPPILLRTPALEARISADGNRDGVGDLITEGKLGLTGVWSTGGGYSAIAVGGGLSLDFDGTSRATFGATLNNRDTDFTFSAWLRPTSNVGARVIVSRLNGSNQGWQLYTSSGVLNFYHDGTNRSLVSSLVLNVWNHVLISHKNARVRSFLNGVLLANTPGGITADAATPVEIGDSTADNIGFIGQMDDIRFFDIPLSGNAISGLASPPQYV